MKTVYWLFVVSVGLFIGGIAFIIAGERTARAATPAAAAAAAGGDRAGRDGQANHDRHHQPGGICRLRSGRHEVECGGRRGDRTAERRGMGESGKRRSRRRGVGKPDVDRQPRDRQGRLGEDDARHDGTGTKAMKAAEAKDKDGIVAAGGDLNKTCDNCHARYRVSNRSTSNFQLRNCQGVRACQSESWRLVS